jgi:hypothetical protein
MKHQQTSWSKERLVLSVAEASSDQQAFRVFRVLVVKKNTEF